MWMLLMITVFSSGASSSSEIGSFKTEKDCEIARAAMLHSSTVFGISEGRKSYICMQK